MPVIGGTAVVVGRSMAGLAAAAALQRSFEQVVVLDRDPIGGDSDERPGVGQGHHVHNLLKGGELSMERLLPGVRDALLAAGAVEFNQSVLIRFYDHGHWLPNRDVGFVNLAATRWLMERVVRERLLRERGVSIVGGRTFQEFTIAPGGHVSGVVATVPGGASETFAADLVLDCTGRGSRSRALLSALGYGEVPEFKINMGLSYTSALFDAPRDALGPFVGLAVLPQPPRKRGVFANLVEDGGWLVSLHTRFEKDLPTTQEEMLAFAEGVEVPDMAQFLRKARIAGPIHTYRKPEATWRRYDKMERFPERLLILGDAMTSFNPVYGQGMSVAWLQACALDDLLQSRANDGRGLDGLAADFFPEAMSISREAWNGSTLVDAAYEEVTGDTRPGTEQGIVLLRALRTLLADDPELHRDYVGVGQMTTPSQVLLTPERIGRAMTAAATL